jgi:hypothetical protein
MPLGLLADLVLALHAAYIAFAALGALVWLRWRHAPLVHLPALAWGAWVELHGASCPLTALEHALRGADGGASRGCIDRALSALVYPAGLTPSIEHALGWGLLALNVGLYALALRMRSRSRAMRPPSAR